MKPYYELTNYNLYGNMVSCLRKMFRPIFGKKLKKQKHAGTGLERVVEVATHNGKSGVKYFLFTDMRMNSVLDIYRKAWFSIIFATTQMKHVVVEIIVNIGGVLDQNILSHLLINRIFLAVERE